MNEKVIDDPSPELKEAVKDLKRFDEYNRIRMRNSTQLKNLKEETDKHVLTIRIPIDAIDDIDARETANELINDLKNGHYYPYQFEAKLQEIYPNKEPRKIALD